MRRDLAASDDIVATVRAAVDDSLVLVIVPGRDAVEQARTLAAIGPLAQEAAPARRVNAVVAAADSDSVAVDAAVAFLESAASTTGQVVTIR